MILKKLKRTNFCKTKAAMIGGLVDYILAKQDEDGNQKFLYGMGFNFLTSGTKNWKWEMISLAEESVQSKMPVAHWVMSWPEDELPSREQVIEATRIFLERMGLAEHQTIIAAHQNTGNFHVHIVVNRTHPATLKVIQPHRGFDINAAHRIVAEISEKQGWATNPHARYKADEQGKVVSVKRNYELVRPTHEAAEMESATGEKSAQRIAQEKGHDIIRNAVTWKELHEKLAAVGLRFARKGSGAVIFVGETAVKASSVDRKFGLSKLCKRLGEYEEGEYPETCPKLAPEPLSPVCGEEWREYQDLRQEHAETTRKARERETAEQEAREQKQMQERKRVCASLAGHGLFMLNIARHLLREKQKQDTPRRPRASGKALPPFRTWLRGKNKRQADIWRYRGYMRRPMREVKSRVFSRTGRIPKPLEAYRAFVEKTFSPERRAQSWKDSLTALYMRYAGYTEKEIADCFIRQNISEDPSDQKDTKFYARMIAQQAFGAKRDIIISDIDESCILRINQLSEKLYLENNKYKYIDFSQQNNGNSEYFKQTENFDKHNSIINADNYIVTYTNTTKEDYNFVQVIDKPNGKGSLDAEEISRFMSQIMDMQKQGGKISFVPVSNDKYHFIINNMTRDQVTQIQKDGFRPAIISWAESDGFQCIIECPKPHTKHDADIERQMMNFFTAKYGSSKNLCAQGKDSNDRETLAGSIDLNGNVMFARRGDCAKSLEMVKNLAKQYIKQDEHDVCARIDGMEGAYRKHLRDIQANHRFNGDCAPEYEIAIRLMYNGYTQEEVCRAVYQCAPSHCKLPHWKKSWGEYAQHVANYAFSASGKAAISRNRENLPHWREVEGRDPDNKLPYPEQPVEQKMNQRVRHSQ
ncbi:relaxase/mobilization nuclease domain-containing protein [Desulfovibrio sp. ZJ200]|uniref:relaxase/mobilization nuclease domain-containing protein n=1 Tax=Desulfovibrio sp. ZJ200 TaxID=2709792 RepID=UPI0013EAC6CF|nr:relaxase/mobilization nuclease domain-containing protein [Desulfovibrio sp. ZJ200]